MCLSLNTQHVRKTEPPGHWVGSRHGSGESVTCLTVQHFKFSGWMSSMFQHVPAQSNIQEKLVLSLKAHRVSDLNSRQESCWKIPPGGRERNSRTMLTGELFPNQCISTWKKTTTDLTSQTSCSHTGKVPDREQGREEGDVTYSYLVYS